MLPMIIIFAGLVFYSSSAAADAPCKLKHSICTEYDQVSQDVHPDDEICFKTAPNWLKLSYLDCQSDLSSAYMYYHKNDVLGGPEPDMAEAILKYKALIYPLHENIRLQARVGQYEVEAPIIMEMFEQALRWAEKEKQKSGDELYALSKSNELKEIYPPDKVDDIQSAYSFLAYEKGNKQAIEDNSREVEGVSP